MIILKTNNKGQIFLNAHNIFIKNVISIYIGYLNNVY